MKTSLLDKFFIVLFLVILSAFALACLYPFYYIFIGSLSSPGAISRGVFLWPEGFNLRTYESIMTGPGMAQSVLISVARTVLGAALVVICSVFVGYIFSYRDIPIRSALYRYFIITMYVNAGFVPWYMLITNMGLRNTFWVYIVPGAFSAFFVILAKTYIESIPESLREAAEIDGAGILRIFFTIIVPLAMPIIACLVVFSAVGQWNAWADTLYFVTDSKLYPMQYRLYNMLQRNMAGAMSQTAGAGAGMSIAEQITPAALRLTMTFVTTMPILAVYPFMQRYFVKGIMIGAVKG